MSGAFAQKAATLWWLAKRPSFYPHMLALVAREAAQWAKDHSVSRDEALLTVGLPVIADSPDAALLHEGTERARQSAVEIGGPGDVDLLYRAILGSKATRVVETGVAYGWSSLVAVAALEKTGGRLVSVDMPYPKADNERFVGIVVPERMRDRRTLIRRPDRNGLKQAIARFDGTIDLCHFDSDKTYSGRMFAYPLLWKALRPGGVFISDDIDDNFGFRDFVQRLGVPFAVVHSDGRSVGIAVKGA